MSIFKDKTIVITGATGSLGREIIANISQKSPKKIIAFSRNESKQHQLKQEFPNISLFVGDVADRSAVFQCIKGADIVIHAAAIKHIPIAQDQPRAACLTNVQGSMNVIDACNEYRVERCVAISTDKSAAPYNVYGMTKYLMERMFLEQENAQCKFLVVRYGNVMCSNGSVVPKWLEMKKKDEPLTVTNPEMTRFFFSIKDAVELIFTTLQHGTPGKIYSYAMKSISIGDLAKMISSDVQVIGSRPGEKVHEELFSEEEMQSVSVLSPSGGVSLMVYDESTTNTLRRSYTSENAPRLTEDEVITMIHDAGQRI